MQVNTNVAVNTNKAEAKQLNTPLRGTPVHINPDAKWIRDGVTVAGGNEYGPELNQFYWPKGLHVDDDQTVYVADQVNSRIMEWKCGATTGQIIAGGNGEGKRNDQLNWPTDVIVDQTTDSLLICDRNNKRVVRWSRHNGTQGETIISNIDCFSLTMDDRGFLYVSDSRKHQVKRYKIGEKHGIVVAGGNRAGDRLDQLSFPTYIFVDKEYSVYVSDMDNDRVMKWAEGAKTGIVVASGQVIGDDWTNALSPEGIVVDNLGTVYIADSSNNRIMRWPKGSTQGSVIIDENSQRGQARWWFHPEGLTFDRYGYLYAVDSFHARVRKFQLDSITN
ncbi:unnamed protein product [Rotaria sp. Silwood1]|nr:unnamed protein product [Rotaria sp. Silwood1]CAF4929522.1 unnamed protein product [Rotaria sp. Silwood1]